MVVKCVFPKQFIIRSEMHVHNVHVTSVRMEKDSVWLVVLRAIARIQLALASRPSDGGEVCI